MFVVPIGAAADLHPSAAEVAGTADGVIDQHAAHPARAELLRHTQEHDLGRAAAALVQLPVGHQLQHRDDLAVVLRHEHVVPVGAIDLGQRIAVRTGRRRVGSAVGRARTAEQGAERREIRSDRIAEVGLHRGFIVPPRGPTIR